MKIPETCLPAVCLCMLAVTTQASEHLRVTGAWIAEAPPGTPVLAGYMTVENQGISEVDILNISSPDFTRIEPHRTVEEHGMVRMHHVSSVTVPAGDKVEFIPGDLHLMLYNAQRTLASGDTVPLTLEFSDQTRLETIAQVKKMSRQLKQQPTGQAPQTDQVSKPAELFVKYQYLLPQHLLSALMYRLSRLEWKPFKNFMINTFMKHFNVDMTDAVETDADDFEHFNAFFTRALGKGTRPVDSSPDALVSPVDGIVSEAGRIKGDALIQAKGKTFTLPALLGNDPQLAIRYKHGTFITFYLAPPDYHRVHMPVAGILQSMTYIPGRLFSVNQASANEIDDLFARNERVINIFTTKAGTMSLIMVGAIFVGSMETVWSGEVTPAETREKSTSLYTKGVNQPSLDKGDEMGRFNMGSTVILLFPPKKVELDEAVKAGYRVKMGKRIGTLLAP